MIREILGADDFPAGARYPTIQLLGKGLLPGINQGLTSANTGVMTYNNRTWLKVTGRTDSWMALYLDAVKFTDAEIKSRKIYGGFRYVIQGNAAAATANPLLRLNIGGGSFDLVLETDLQRSTDEVYIKWCIDCPNLKVTAWLDGSEVKTLTMTAAQVAAVTAANTRILYGQIAGGVTSENHLYNDFYWEIDTFDLDGIVAGKLGPVKVKSVKVAGTVLPSDWSVSDGSSPDAVLDATGMAPSTELSPVIRTSPAESVASVGFARPAAELAIKAVSMEVFGFRDSGTSPTLQVQLKQGDKTLPKKSVSMLANDFNRGANTDRLGCFNVDLNGAAWTNESIDALEVLVNSKTGS